jgi:hypothetical protein
MVVAAVGKSSLTQTVVVMLLSVRPPASRGDGLVALNPEAPRT